jgi:hypothetical protein
MRVRWYVVPAFTLAVAGMALAGCSDAEPSPPEPTASETSESAEKSAEPASKVSVEPVGATTVSFKEAVEYKDGLKFEITKIQHGEVGQFAYGAKPGEDETIFTISITNSGKEDFDPDTVTPTATYGEAGKTAATTSDTEEDTGNGFVGKVRAGKSLTAAFAFVIPKAERGNITLQLKADPPERKTAIFTGPAQ